LLGLGCAHTCRTYFWCKIWIKKRIMCWSRQSVKQLVIYVSCPSEFDLQVIWTSKYIRNYSHSSP
jgi:hypothetical protein